MSTLTEIDAQKRSADQRAKELEAQRKGLEQRIKDQDIEKKRLERQIATLDVSIKDQLDRKAAALTREASFMRTKAAAPPTL